MKIILSAVEPALADAWEKFCGDVEGVEVHRGSILDLRCDPDHSIIDHGLGLTTLYMHLSRFDVKEGEHVKRGQVIAKSGATGRATGPHLHLSARWDGEYLDPAKLFLLKLPIPAE